MKKRRELCVVLRNMEHSGIWYEMTELNVNVWLIFFFDQGRKNTSSYWSAWGRTRVNKCTNLWPRGLGLQPESCLLALVSWPLTSADVTSDVWMNGSAPTAPGQTTWAKGTPHQSLGGRKRAKEVFWKGETTSPTGCVTVQLKYNERYKLRENFSSLKMLF